MENTEKIEYTIGWESYIYYVDPGQDAIQEGLVSQTMSFVLTEGFYNHCMDYVERMLEHESSRYTKDYWEGYKRACLYWLHWANKFCSDYPPKMRKPTDEEQKKFKFIEEFEDGAKVEWPLVGVVDYRGGKLPVYDDDYGQSYFCKLPDGHCVSGGGWNPDPEDEFCYEYDEYLQREGK